MRMQNKKHMSHLTAEQRARLKTQRDQKEVAQFLMPDAPPKKTRKVSPQRILCPLVPGTPKNPPPRVPQPWELKKKESAPDTSSPSRFPDPESDAISESDEIADPRKKSKLVFTPLTAILAVEDDTDLRSNIVADVKLIGLSPAPSTSQSLSPVPPSSSRAPSTSQSLSPVQPLSSSIAPSTSQSLSPVQPLSSSIAPSTSRSLSPVQPPLSSIAPSTSRSLSPVPPASSSTRLNPMIYDDGIEREILEWERSVGEIDPGSDIDEEEMVADYGFTSNEHVEELPGALTNELSEMDQQDDSDLRELANQEMMRFEWSNDPNTFTGQRDEFTGQAGPTFSSVGMSPLQVLKKIWDDDIINLIVQETNKYAADLPRHLNIRQFSRILRWKPITPEELWKFFGIIMLQSIVSIGVEEEYWKPCLHYLKIGNFRDLMTYYRFTLIKRCLHFVDNNDLSFRDVPTKLSKIKPIVDHLNNKFSSLYLPEQNIAIDESLLLWSGRLSFAQRITKKAAGVGIKSYELCESRTGYLWKMMIHTGKGNKSVSEVHDERAPNGATSKIVYSLVRPLLNKGHTLVMDNFYNSPLLSRTLKAQKTDTMGTLRLNRKFVPESLRCKNKTNMRTGEVAFSQTEDLTIIVWKDTNVVSLISTFHNVEVGGKEKHGKYKYKPQVVLDYNLSMGGIDKKDQLLQAFPVERVRNSIWYKKVFRRLLNVSIHNAFVIFANNYNNITQRQFRLSLVDEILGKFLPQKIQVAPAVAHFPARNNKRKARCKHCARKKKDTCTVWKCDTCNVNLCLLDCFRDYHTS